MKKIGELWDEVICFDSPTKNGDCFESTKILIDTTCLSVIQDWVCFLLNGSVCDVHIKEMQLDYGNNLQCSVTNWWSVLKIQIMVV